MSDQSENKERLFKYVKDYYWNISLRNSAILSSTCRQLALGLGSLSWIAKSNSNYSQAVLQANAILLLVVIFFICDAIQYLKQFYSYCKLAADYDSEIEAGKITEISKLIEKPGMNKLAYFFFTIKLSMLIFASICFVALICMI